jgi:hypothetical protein
MRNFRLRNFQASFPEICFVQSEEAPESGVLTLGGDGRSNQSGLFFAVLSWAGLSVMER